MFESKEHAHRRLNILTGEWVQVSPHRAKRPWQGQVEELDQVKRPAHDPTCYLCAGNERVGGEKNPDYTSTFVFTNDFGALQSDIPEGGEANGLLQSKSERGICKVICFSPRHDLTIPEMEVKDITKVVDLWVEECQALSKHDFINHIQIFENKGSVMGCSNPHPHGQIWAQESIPDEPLKKEERQAEHFLKHGKGLLAEYLSQEMKVGDRVLYENEDMAVLVPFWAIWPFEAMIIPKRKMARIIEMSARERKNLADAFRYLTIKYDNLFKCTFPYSAGIHQAPYDEQEHLEWHWHMSFYPPLLRSATVKKFMVGYEMLASPQRDITPEWAARQLKKQPNEHYSKRAH